MWSTCCAAGFHTSYLDLIWASIQHRTRVVVILRFNLLGRASETRPLIGLHESKLEFVFVYQQREKKRESQCRLAQQVNMITFWEAGGTRTAVCHQPFLHRQQHHNQNLLEGRNLVSIAKIILKETKGMNRHKRVLKFSSNLMAEAFSYQHSLLLHHIFKWDILTCMCRTWISSLLDTPLHSRCHCNLHLSMCTCQTNLKTRSSEVRTLMVPETEVPALPWETRHFLSRHILKHMLSWYELEEELKKNQGENQRTRLYTCVQLVWWMLQWI